MRKELLIIVSFMILMGCGGKNSTPTPGPVPAPAKAALSVPAQNAICITGSIISTMQSSVDFSWNASSNTDSYDLVIKNLLTAGISTQNTTQTQLTVTLLRNTPYSWWIVSKSAKSTTTTQSDTWKFLQCRTGCSNLRAVSCRTQCAGCGSNRKRRSRADQPAMER